MATDNNRMRSPKCDLVANNYDVLVVWIGQTETDTDSTNNETRSGAFHLTPNHVGNQRFEVFLKMERSAYMQVLLSSGPDTTSECDRIAAKLVQKVCHECVPKGRFLEGTLRMNMNTRLLTEYEYEWRDLGDGPEARERVQALFIPTSSVASSVNQKTSIKQTPRRESSSSSSNVGKHMPIDVPSDDAASLKPPFKALVKGEKLKKKVVNLADKRFSVTGVFGGLLKATIDDVEDVPPKQDLPVPHGSQVTSPPDTFHEAANFVSKNNQVSPAEKRNQDPAVAVVQAGPESEKIEDLNLQTETSQISPVDAKPPPEDIKKKRRRRSSLLRRSVTGNLGDALRNSRRSFLSKAKKPSISNLDLDSDDDIPAWFLDNEDDDNPHPPASFAAAEAKNIEESSFPASTSARIQTPPPPDVPAVGKKMPSRKKSVNLGDYRFKVPAMLAELIKSSEMEDDAMIQKDLKPQAIVEPIETITSSASIEKPDSSDERYASISHNVSKSADVARGGLENMEQNKARKRSSLVQTVTDSIRLLGDTGRSFIAKTKAADSQEKEVDIMDLTTDDVIFCSSKDGRGGRLSESYNIGNNRFRVVINMNKSRFSTADSDGQFRIISEIYGVVVKGRSLPARFLEETRSPGMLYEISKDNARSRIENELCGGSQVLAQMRSAAVQSLLIKKKKKAEKNRLGKNSSQFTEIKQITDFKSAKK
mmetsp:Transcript_7482/g.13471  ORF Transcript_7482/g.13471 Transcript_7482/m.13471 type:complete len:706 (-) Transcript_7482:225-2342(-)